MKQLRIWDRPIGDGHPPYFVAELGICHQGCLETALENTRQAVAAGADCIKSELFHETEVFDPSARKTYTIGGKEYSVPLLEHMRKYQFTLDQHHQIKKLCDDLGVPFMATAHDFKRVDFLVDIQAAAIKIASPDIVHYPLIKYAARSGLALFLDTGGAYQYEVEMAVKVAREGGFERLVVNHNPDGHPALPKNHNLLTMQRYKDLFGTPVGFADHYDGYQMLYAAVALGANVIEKPISHDPTIPECEQNWAIAREHLPLVIKTIRDVYEARGQQERTMREGLRPKSEHRVALVTGKDLKAGDVLNEENIIFGKPRRGIGVEHWELVEGRPLKTDKSKHEFIQWSDL